MPIDMPPQPPAVVHAATAPAAWTAREAVIAAAEKERPGIIYREEKVPAYTLPPVPGPDVSSAAEWETVARPALVEQFSRLVYGVAPKVPAGVAIDRVDEDIHALGGKATRRQYRITVPTPNGPFAFPFSVLTPNGAAGKVPAFLLLNNRPLAAADPERKKADDFWPVETIIARGYATAVLQLRDVQPDKPDGLSAGIVHALPSDAPVGERWATLAAWAWAASRVLDGLQTVTEIDGTRVAVIGHSRGGKTALWAGATDPRFGMVISNCSGSGGAAPGRRSFGETIAKINEVFPHWFCEKFKTFNGRPEAMPIDQHQLLATILPRPLYVGCADEDLWADPRGEFIALSAASAVAPLYGQPTLGMADLPPIDRSLVRGRLGYHVRTGGHDLTAWDWDQYLAFADTMWKK